MKTGESRRRRLREPPVHSSFTDVRGPGSKSNNLVAPNKSTGGTIQSCYED